MISMPLIYTRNSIIADHDSCIKVISVKIVNVQIHIKIPNIRGVESKGIMEIKAINEDNIIKSPISKCK
jgi:hypothetical protein